MPYLMNALPWPVTTQAHGQWFSFQPEQIKMIHDTAIAHFMVTKRGPEGIVEVPEAVMEMKTENPTEFKAAIEELRQDGIRKKTESLKQVVHNLEVSLRRDLEMKNIKADPLTFASKGEVVAYKQLAELEILNKGKLVTTADEIRAIKEKLNGDTNVSNSGTASKGSPVNTQAAKS